MKSTKLILAAAAMSGLIAGSTARAAIPVSGKGDSKMSVKVDAGVKALALAEGEKGKHDCAGKNECKGQGGCKTADHACAGKNDCKGKGGCSSAHAPTTKPTDKGGEKPAPKGEGK